MSRKVFLALFCLVFLFTGASKVEARTEAGNFLVAIATIAGLYLFVNFEPAKKYGQTTVQFHTWAGGKNYYYPDYVGVRTFDVCSEEIRLPSGEWRCEEQTRIRLYLKKEGDEDEAYVRVGGITRIYKEKKEPWFWEVPYDVCARRKLVWDDLRHLKSHWECREYGKRPH